MIKRPRVLFFGTPAFAVPSLEAINTIAEIVAVVTHVDAPAGRGQREQPSPVHKRAVALNLQVLMPERLDHPFLAAVKALKPDVAVLAAYGKIAPKKLLNIPSKGFLNVHPSLLPQHRGASPVAAALLAGEAETGVTIMVLDEELDHGPMVAQRALPIEPHEHRPSLEQRLAKLGAELLTSSLLPYLAGELHSKPQDHAKATLTKMLKRQDAVIDWRRSSVEIENQICALDPWPGTITHSRGSTLKILDGQAENHNDQKQRPGTVMVLKTIPAVVCGQGVLVLTRLQLPGKNPTDASAFLRGHKDFVGAILGR